MLYREKLEKLLVEFYLGDSNLPLDNFLRTSISETSDGMVSLALICSFSRMRTHLGLGEAKANDIPEDTVQAVAETLRKSSFIQISKDGKKVGRVTPLPNFDEAIKQLDVRTVAVSPLEFDAKLEDLESLFAKRAKVNSVRMPRHVADKRLFCGTALIEFSTEEDAEKILKQSFNFAGAALELKPKKEFDVERVKQEEEVEKTKSQSGSSGKNNSNSEPDYPKGLIVAFKLKRSAKVTTEDSNNKPADGGVETPKPESNEVQINTGETEAKKSGDDHDETIKMSKEKGEDMKLTKKIDETEVLESEVMEDDTNQKDDQAPGQEKVHPSAYKDDKDVLREDLKSVFQKFGTVKFVDFKIGSESGHIRFEDAGASQKARAAAVLADEGGVIVKNYVAVLDPLTGEAEKEYWGLLRVNQDRHRDNSKGRDNFRGHRGRGGRHNRGGKTFRSRDNDAGGRPNKAQKV